LRACQARQHSLQRAEGVWTGVLPDIDPAPGELAKPRASREVISGCLGSVPAADQKLRR